MDNGIQNLPVYLQNLIKKELLLKSEMECISKKYFEASTKVNKILIYQFLNYYNIFSKLYKHALKHQYNLPEVHSESVFFESDNFDIEELDEIKIINVDSGFLFFKAYCYSPLGKGEYFKLSIPVKYLVTNSSEDDENNEKTENKGIIEMEDDAETIRMELNTLDVTLEKSKERKKKEREKKTLKILIDKYGNI